MGLRYRYPSYDLTESYPKSLNLQDDSSMLLVEADGFHVELLGRPGAFRRIRVWGVKSKAEGFEVGWRAGSHG